MKSRISQTHVREICTVISGNEIFLVYYILKLMWDFYFNASVISTNAGQISGNYMLAVP